MGLEATVVILDNSDWSRNGDYQPTRWDSQEQAVNLISENRLESNPENSMGIISMAGKRVDVHSTLSNEITTIVNSVKKVEINGDYCDMITAMNIAFLTLKHRPNKNQKQRIIVFVGSPLKHSAQDLMVLARKLKKNNIAVDIVSFGNIEDNKERLEKFISLVNNSNNSNLTEIPQGYYIVDYLLTTPLMAMGMENFNNIDQPAGNNANNAGAGVGMSQFDKDIQAAMQMSMNENKVEEAPPKKEEKSNTADQTTKQTPDEVDFDNMTDEQLIEQAMKMSLVEEKQHKEEKKLEEEVIKGLTNDPDFVKELLEEVGEDGGDDAANQVLKKLNEDKDHSDDKNKK